MVRIIIKPEYNYLYNKSLPELPSSQNKRKEKNEKFNKVINTTNTILDTVEVIVSDGRLTKAAALMKELMTIFAR